MKRFFCTIAIGFFLLQSAHALTIDFEELGPTTGFIPGPIVSKGFLFSYTDTGPSNPTNFLVELTNPGPFDYLIAYCGCEGLRMQQEDGLQFSLTSADLYTLASLDPIDPFNVTGYYAAGGTVTLDTTITPEPSTISFDTQWSGLDRVVFGTSGGLGTYIDNIDVSVVPLPAAAWLFLSALAGLFGVKRSGLFRGRSE